MKSADRNLIEEMARSLLIRHPKEAGPVLSGFDIGTISDFLKSAPEAFLSPTTGLLPPETLGEILEAADDTFLESLGRNMNPTVLAMALGRMDAKSRQLRIKTFPRPVQTEIEEFLVYPEGTAGALMERDVLRCYPGLTVLEALKKVREANNPFISDLCLCDAQGFLTGTLSVQQLAMAEDGTLLSELPSSLPQAVVDIQDGEDVFQFMEERKLASIPVVDFENRLLGIIRSDSLVSLAKKEGGDDLQAMFGAGRDERGLSKVGFTVGKRLPWLQINLVTAFLASAVVGMFEGTIAKITALAVFLPVVAGQSGNSGSQALAVTMRALALREIRPSQWFRLVRKEAMAGLINGVAVATVTATVVYFWNRSAGLSLIIGVSMVISMVLAGIAGAVIPIVLKVVGQDPALSSTIILTTVTDIVGFLTFLGLATVLAGALNLV